MIQGDKIGRPSKAELASGVAKALGLEVPEVARGSSVESSFLDQIHAAITGQPSGEPDTYRKTESVMHALGLTYDPYWDTSEAAPNGGGTVTTRAFSRIHAAVSKTPRTFILAVNDAQVGARWEVDHTVSYRYDTTVSGRGSFNDAGPGSRVLFYSTAKSSLYPKAFVAHAVVRYIGPGWTGPWEAAISNYEELPTPVPVEGVEIPGWNRQNAITEISFATYAAVIGAGGADVANADLRSRDTGGDVVAERILNDRLEGAGRVQAVAVPVDLPSGQIPAGSEEALNYAESDDGSVSGKRSFVPRTPEERRKDKLAEKRAVSLATEGLVAAGWMLERDRQADGVGYDLEFAKGGRVLHVEVKGIQGRRPTFNLTPKELWRATWDDSWVLVAVTNVLSPSAYEIELIPRDAVLSYRRVVTGYRVN